MRRIIGAIAFFLSVATCTLAGYGYGEYVTRMRHCYSIGAIAQFELNRGYSLEQIMVSLAYIETTIEMCEGTPLTARIK